MVRFLSLLLLLLLGTARASEANATSPFDGVWEITALIDDGEVIPSVVIRQSLAVDGRMTVNGQAISFNRPNGEKKVVLFTTDTRVTPAAIDLAGSDKTGGRGIFVINGDMLMICLSGPELAVRPTSFASTKNSNAMLMTLQRVRTVAPPSTLPLPPAPVNDHIGDAGVRRLLIGSWGHQDSERIEYGTFNSDGSFSMNRQWKKSFRRYFTDDERFSGDWKLENGTLVVRITAATDPKVRGQVFSYRINSINDREMVLLDDAGNVRREWRTSPNPVPR